MAGKMSSEVLAIQKLRETYPNASQTQLTNRILATQQGVARLGNGQRFYSLENVTAAKNAGSRTFYSIYSVIRRYDAKRKLAATAA